MARTKLISELKTEIDHYLGIPYFINSQKLAKDNLYVGKGTWQEIKKISNDYKTLKKLGIGIDCSGLVVHLLNFFFDLHLDVRKTSANMLTSPPLSSQVSDYAHIKTGDLVRQKNGHHVLFVIKANNQNIECVESSRQGRGVHYSSVPKTSKPQIFRLTSLQ